MKRIYLNHGEAYGNLGDEAMLLCAAHRIRARIGAVEFVVPRIDGAPLPDIGPIREIPSPSHALLKVLKPLFFNFLGRRMDRLPYPQIPLAIARLMIILGRVKEWGTLRRELKECDAVYCVGAANLNDFARYGHLLPKAMLIEEAFRSRVPCVVSSQTVGPLKRKWTRQLATRAVRMSDFFSVRDGGISRQILAKSGLTDAKIPFSGDEAFSLVAASEDAACEYLRMQGIDPNRPFGILHFRATDYTKSTKTHYRKLASGIEASSLKSQILFLPMSYWTHSGSDYECGEAIKSFMLHKEKMRVLRPTCNVQIIRRLAEMANWLMALSYHVQVFALAAAKPLALISSGDYYRVKAEGMKMLLGHTAKLLDLDQISHRDITQALHDLEINPRSKMESMAKLRASVLETNDLPIVALESLLGS